MLLFASSQTCYWIASTGQECGQVPKVRFLSSSSFQHNWICKYILRCAFYLPQIFQHNWICKYLLVILRFIFIIFYCMNCVVISFSLYCILHWQLRCVIVAFTSALTINILIVCPHYFFKPTAFLDWKFFSSFIFLNWKLIWSFSVIKV